MSELAVQKLLSTCSYSLLLEIDARLNPLLRLVLPKPDSHGSGTNERRRIALKGRTRRAIAPSNLLSIRDGEVMEPEPIGLTKLYGKFVCRISHMPPATQSESTQPKFYRVKYRDDPLEFATIYVPKEYAYLFPN